MRPATISVGAPRAARIGEKIDALYDKSDFKGRELNVKEKSEKARRKCLVGVSLAEKNA
jgi:hypothetical protein